MADKPLSSTSFGQHSPAKSSATFSPFSPAANSNRNTTMVSNTTPNSTDSKKSFDISNLMSPPELPPFESFAQSSMLKPMGSITSEMRRLPGPNPPLSPPISPLTKSDDRMPSVAPSTPVQDPILYPAQDISSSPPQQPLFAQDESVDTQRIVDDHVVARPAAFFRQATPPEREDYELMLFFKSQVMQKYNENPRGWLQRERAQLLADRRAGARYNQFKLHPILPAKPQAIRSHAQRVVKTPKAIKPLQSAAPRVIRSNPPAQRQERPAAARRVSATPDPASRRVVAPNREDKDFNSLPDFSPPLNSLPSKANSLKVDWKGAPIDLSGDPQRDLLHPDEVALAANLRLDCATYLTSKRRMFIKRLECIRIGKEFRKTDAQQACKIDVNKASKLWTAFEKVGWLEKRWVSRFM